MDKSNLPMSYKSVSVFQEWISKLYGLTTDPTYRFDEVYPHRSRHPDSDLTLWRANEIKTCLMPADSAYMAQLAKKNKKERINERLVNVKNKIAEGPIFYIEEYKPFDTAELSVAPACGQQTLRNQI